MQVVSLRGVSATEVPGGSVGDPAGGSAGEVVRTSGEVWGIVFSGGDFGRTGPDVRKDVRPLVLGWALAVCGFDCGKADGDKTGEDNEQADGVDCGHGSDWP